jgi:hypothetical protein
MHREPRHAAEFSPNHNVDARSAGGLQRGIDLVAEASLRRLMATRIRRAAAMGEVDRRALRASALVGL